jgi:histidyl-tRNA synthetase
MGDKEVQLGKAIIKNLKDRSQTEVALNEISNWIKSLV